MKTKPWILSRAARAIHYSVVIIALVLGAISLYRYYRFDNVRDLLWAIVDIVIVFANLYMINMQDRFRKFYGD